MSYCNESHAVPVWITDGSMVEFTDTKKLTTKAPPVYKFLREKYEGLLDPNVFIGSGCIPWEEGGHDAELEWCLIFEKPINQIDFNSGTSCQLQGMIEGKNLAKLRGLNPIPWGPASLKNNVLATLDPSGKTLTKGVPIKLEQLSRGTILASMHLTFEKENGAILNERIVHSTVLMNFPIIKFLRELSDKADDFNLTECRIINLGANGENSGYVNQKAKRNDALLSSLFKNNPIDYLSETPDILRHYLIDDLIKDKEGMKKGGVARLNVIKPDSERIGEATLITQ